MPVFPSQGGSKNTWGTELRNFFAPLFDLATGARVAGQIVSADIADGTIVDADIAAGAGIAQSKLVDIVDADIAVGAGIAQSKLIDIVDADIAAGAAIVDTKLATITTADKVSDTSLNIPNVKFMSTYADFATAVSTIGVNVTTLIISELEAVAANVTIPATLSLKFMGQGELSVNATFTVTINVSLSAPLKKIFGGMGGIIFGPDSVREVYPQWWGAVADGVADDTTSIQAAITAIAPQIPLDNQAVFFTEGADVFLPSGNYKISQQINVWPWVNIKGAGMSNSLISATGSDAGLTFPRLAPNLAAQDNKGGESGGFGVYGSNTVTTQLVSMDTVVSRSFKDIIIQWSLGDGLVLDNVQNSLFSNMVIEANGNTATVTGSNMVIKNRTASNVFMRMEMGSPSEYNLEIIADAAGNIDKNIFIGSTFEFFKGKFAGTHFASAIPPVMKAHVFVDGANGNVVNTTFSDSNITLNGTNLDIPAIKLVNGGQILFHNMMLQGHLGNSISRGVEIGPTTGPVNFVTFTGFSNLSGFQTLFDTFGASSHVRMYGDASFLTSIVNVTSSDSGRTQDNIITSPIAGIIDLKRGNIQFPVTQNSSTNVNTLDDYREGSFTPGLSFGGNSVGMTFSVQTAGYRKIGSLVFISGQIVLTAKGTSVGSVEINGLPFTSGLTKPGMVSFGSYSGMSLTASSTLAGESKASSTLISLFQNSNTTNSPLTEANFTNTSNFTFSLVYIAVS